MLVDLARWVGDIASGKRNPHWLHLAMPALVSALALYLYLTSERLSYVPPVAFQPNLVRVAVALAAFFVVFCLLLMHFNARAKDTHSSLVVFNGELRYEDEIHIALHIVTLKNLISSMVAKAKPADAKKALFESGLVAGVDFGQKFPQIYDEELKSKNRDIKWGDLSLQDRMDLWADFDKGAGWGRFSVINSGQGGVLVQIHHVSMFTGDAGPLVGEFISGYVLGVVQQLAGRNLTLAQPSEVIGNDHNRLLVRIGA